MRKLNTKDLFKACRIIKSLGAKEMISKAMDVVNKAKTEAEGKHLDAETVGFNAFMELFDKIAQPSTEAALYDLLAGPFELTPDEVGELPLLEMRGRLSQLAAENNLTLFFEQLSDMMR